MTLAPRLRARARVTAALAPTVRGSLAVLRMPLADLQAELAREAADNPFLIFRPSAAGAATDHTAALAARPTLIERLRGQIALMPLAPAVRAMAEHLAGELREDGFLDAPLGEIAAELGAPPDLAEAGLVALQGCEPAGVGARDLAECLALQLSDRGLAPDLARAVVGRLEDFVAADWAGLGRALGLPRDRLVAIAALLPGLSARPVSPADEAAPPLLPDLVLERRPEGGFAVRLAREARPRLAVDPALAGRADLGAEAVALRSRAEALVAAVAARGATLLRLGAWIGERQATAFLEGLDHLVPLSRAEAALALGMHPSTVGRAAAGKAIAFEGRVHPLSRFFGAPLPQAHGPALTGFVVRQRIARLVAGEPEAKPFSDAAIQAALAADGVDIARRTVTKYRLWMGLPSSRQRRRQTRLREAADGRGR